MSASKPMKEKRVLLIEDEPNYRSLILTVLRKAGIQCTFCIDGDHAIKKLAQETFDLAIIDYLLPGPNAIDIVRWMRTQKITTPALIITNYPSDDLTVKSKELTRTKLIPKPTFDPANMPAIVQEMLAS
jgi:DNA-binding response OmpR family regulator